VIALAHRIDIILKGSYELLESVSVFVGLCASVSMCVCVCLFLCVFMCVYALTHRIEILPTVTYKLTENDCQVCVCTLCACL
jgi:hypothetical protein